MKSLITWATLTAAVLAADGRVTSVQPGCAHDNCLRKVIAGSFTTRPGYSHCVSWLLTTVIPPSALKVEVEYTLATSTATTSTQTDTENFITPPPSPQEKRNTGHIEYLHPNEKGFKKKVKRATTSSTIVNLPPDYIIEGCTDQGGTRSASFRYSSACSCVGATAGDPLIAAQGTITSTEVLPSPDTTSIVYPTKTETIYVLKASVSGGNSAASGKYLASSTLPASSAWLIAATGSVAATAPTMSVYPNGKTTFGGKLIVARKSSTFTNVSFLELVTDSQPIPANNLPVSCKINPDYSITCKSPSEIDGPEDRGTLYITGGAGGGAYTLRLVKDGTSPPPSDFFLFTLKPLPPT
ncbi:hypothetical protein EYR41_004861 [Orbilia oligospora]|uniref:Uncharacterized protein n=1 Tax=Orbilia oligospora TaxID=2813651 RepID=A0A7C8KC06_ORBOL|nr:hypothetical protein TWF751_010815 [Orbilia oligospora]TGJ68776.1 hypothetical protein EYR41_004861 [Orbilia oligospora]